MEIVCRGGDWTLIINLVVDQNGENKLVVVCLDGIEGEQGAGGLVLVSCGMPELTCPLFGVSMWVAISGSLQCTVGLEWRMVVDVVVVLTGVVETGGGVCVGLVCCCCGVGQGMDGRVVVFWVVEVVSHKREATKGMMVADGFALVVLGWSETMGK